MTRTLNEKQTKFLEVLFEEAGGDVVTAKKLAGYSNNTPTTSIVEGLKDEIFEVIKSQNIIDVRTPSFFNIKLILRKQDDLIKFQTILRDIDLIENYKVNEFSKRVAYIKIKYYGKINKITEKLSQRGLKINAKNEKWEVSLK